MMNTKNKKVLLLGWDAADWKVISPLLDKGLMPNLEKLITEGVMGNLQTLDPPYSPMLWTSIATGKRADKHGILGFNEPWDKGQGMRPVMSTSRKVKAIWNILTQKDYKTHMVGWWPSHPAEPINGIAISDFYQQVTGQLYDPWPLVEGSVYPKEMTEHFAALRVHPRELTAAHILPFVPEAHKINQNKDYRLYNIARETAQAASLHAAFTNILRTQEWDFAALYLPTLDHYCHSFMKYYPPKRPHIPQRDYDMFHQVVDAGYRFHDMMLGRILEFADEDTFVFLVSDHGFQPDHLRPRTIPNEPAGPTYEHSPYGIFTLKGPGIKKDEMIFGANLLDVTPTILACLDLPVGKDMDGKVLAQVFEEPNRINIIESWEMVEGTCGMHPRGTEVEEDITTLAIEQLVDLGYLEEPDDDVETNRKKATEECQFNLARVYVSAGKTDKAIPILEELYKTNPTVSRYAFKLATCYQLSGELKKCRKIIDHLRDQEMYDETTLDVMEGSLLLGEQQPIKAIKLFKKAESKRDEVNARLQLQIARGYIMLRRWKDAERALTQEIAEDEQDPDVLELLGIVYLYAGEFNRSVETLLQSIGLDYERPNAHWYLGDALYRLGDYQQAAQAYEVYLVMEPMDDTTRTQLIDLYVHHLEQPVEARDHETKLSNDTLSTITIVSGLPRSGTSLMMQMLKKGGMDCLTDHHREADENNPKGYFEYEAVKTLPEAQEWLSKANGKAVKIIAQLLPDLPPNYRYKIIFMDRDLDEIVASQRSMLKRMGKKTRDDDYPLHLMKAYQQTLERTKQWASRHPLVEILYISHQSVMEEPFEIALQINEFLDYTLLPELMVRVVDPQLYRERNNPTIQ